MFQINIKNGLDIPDIKKIVNILVIFWFNSETMKIHLYRTYINQRLWFRKHKPFRRRNIFCTLWHVETELSIDINFH